MAEDLTEYLMMNLIKVKYIHHNIDTVERTEIIRDLRLGVFDVLVGVNLLREGLDIPEVSLVAILDADKEGFLRGETSLIQTIGRAARNAEGTVIMYADKITRSMKVAIDETARRREKQDAYNRLHGIVPKTIKKDIRELIDFGDSKSQSRRSGEAKKSKKEKGEKLSVAELERLMREAASKLDFETAAVYRDRIRALEKQ
jgi:excinuclease ABC subunit B